MRFEILVLLFTLALVSATAGTLNQCPANEDFKECGTACEPTCANPRPQVCTMQCLVNVCQCKPGYVRRYDGQCVEERYFAILSKSLKGLASGSVDGAGGTLLGGHQISNKCSVQCVAKMCGCGKVYIPLSESENLYKGFKSSNRCPVNEEFLKCGSSCEPSCENPHPKICTAECILDVCQCKEGYVRRSDGRCVKMANCH
ncbi:zonadhesin-like [Ctenocephalides felis]|uniref:zonadhesin-like n=1 Tax=Ctenocephalides felis TaxID=7515 RepID=UPI000E6E55F4|nr:zonadhesin-like [Ctenocephalides felis]